MRLMENLRIALEGLRANKMRALLTMLGIIIGIAAVIGILTVGDGLSNTITSQMSSFGASTISISLQQKTSQLDMSDLSSMMVQPEDGDLITDDMIEEMLARYGADIKAVGLTESVGSGQVKDGRLYANVSVSGVNDGAFTINDVDLQAGRFLQQQDCDGERDVCVVSDKLVQNLFAGDAQAALGSEISVQLRNDRVRLRIVGVYTYKASAFTISTASDKDLSTALYIPVTSAKRLTGAADGYSYFTVMAAGADSTAVGTQISNFLNRYYRNNDDYRVTSMSMESVIESVDSMMRKLSIAISVIAAISLLVGGIGVMNIMLVSVTERTREIGTRKALGATNGDIREQFVVESIIICLVGGIIGILLGTLLGYVGSSLLDAPSLPSAGSIALAVGFSLAVGVFFGYYPANKAAKLDPIEALRYE
ncbi:MAG: ABC transporter permease [Clostridiales bacterium]|nr:ABC transporter permease [Clostridiales bacterium]